MNRRNQIKSAISIFTQNVHITLQSTKQHTDTPSQVYKSQSASLHIKFTLPSLDPISQSADDNFISRHRALQISRGFDSGEHFNPTLTAKPISPVLCLSHSLGSPPRNCSSSFTEIKCNQSQLRKMKILILRATGRGYCVMAVVT